MAFDLSKPAAGGGGGKKRAPLGAQVADPLAGVEYTGNVEEDAKAEFSALDSAYRDRARKEADRFTATTDSEYWFAVCFKSRADKEAFLAAAGVKTKLMGDKYLSGYDLAAVLGVDMSEGERG